MGSVNTILQANNTTRIAKANWRAAVAQSKNTNKLEVAKGGFSDFMRSLGNQSRVNAASKEYNFQMEQLSEELRAKQGAGFNTQVQLAAARGALSAQSGFVGVGGSSADLMDTMVRLQAEMDQETQHNAMTLLASRGASQTAQIMANAYKGMDISRTFGQFDYQQHIEPKRMKGRFGKLVAVAVATYFGGPQAGEAVADLAVADWQASNGNFQGASQTWDSAIQNGLGAWQGMSQRGGKSWASSTFNYNDGTGQRARPAGTGARVTQQLGNNYDNFTTSTSGLGWFGGGNSGGAW